MTYLIALFIIWLFVKKPKWQKTGEVMMYFGLLFFGLYLLEMSVSPLKNDGQISNWVTQINNPVRGAAVGGLATLIIQSSSATVGMLIIMAKQQFIGLSGAVAIMLGAELGTCSDTLLAIVGGKRDALRAGLFQIIFNLIPITFGLMVFDHFVAFVEWTASNASISRQIANAHVLFSVFSVLLFLPFIKPFYKLIYYIIPHKN